MPLILVCNYYRCLVFFHVLPTRTVIPHRGAGANMAIEDAEALGQYLQDATVNEIDTALDHVFRVRFKRATRFQLLSHREGLRMKRTPNGRERDYLGAKEWETSFPDMVVKEGEEAMYSLEN
jgi:hypothetical protein